MKNLGRSYTNLWWNLRRHYRYTKCCHSKNPLSAAVNGQILWAKNNWQPEWRFL